MSAVGDRPAIARAFVALGRTLGLKVVAEGIEVPDQAAWLVSLGCPLGQRYPFSRPLGVEATAAFLAADATHRIPDRASDTRGDAPTDLPDPTRRHASMPLRLVSGE
jgi:predicted signal transduction protein with EAL and GGDEF domain